MSFPCHALRPEGYKPDYSVSQVGSELAVEPGHLDDARPGSLLQWRSVDLHRHDRPEVKLSTGKVRSRRDVNQTRWIAPGPSSGVIFISEPFRARSYGSMCLGKTALIAHGLTNACL